MGPLLPAVVRELINYYLYCGQTVPNTAPYICKSINESNKLFYQHLHHMLVSEVQSVQRMADKLKGKGHIKLKKRLLDKKKKHLNKFQSALFIKMDNK